MYEKTTTGACSSEMKSKVKCMFLKQSKEKHMINSSEMRKVPQAHVKEKIITLPLTRLEIPDFNHLQ